MTAARATAALALALALAACQRKAAPPAATGGSDGGVAVATDDAGPAARPQVKPPLPLAPVPADAEVITGVVEAPTARVLIKRLRAGTGGRPGRNDNVELEFSGWRPNGDTFITTAARKRALPRNLATTAPGFAAAVQSMQVGERAMVWVPAELSYPGQPTGTPEATIYEIELVGFEPSPPTPPDVGAPPATAAATPSGLRSLVVKPGTGTTHPRSFDLVTYHYTAWDATGRLFDSSELRKRPTTTLGFREFRGIEEALTLMVVGERRRVWLPPSLTEQSLPGLPRGTLCYELEVTDLVPKAAPPPAPSRAELAAPPADARTTARGARLVIRKAGTGKVHPTPADTVKVSFSGWTADGHLFDSSIPHGVPIDAPVGKFIPGWVDALTQMVVGDRARVWVPVELAFNHEPGRPAGPLVFDLELLAIEPPTPPVTTTVPATGPANPAVKLVPTP
ncbi:MAG: FKBP-type peptidyl-prolyl cis-trans isomerase [Myxococcales bacterium]|nr:FKBP-type peptidyl-prolyl cis-trans isomerase [Myxococcales bacterium]MBK7191559.1 FKBP-type peptidyl-prolyl cis-trans isomerase [Myxococcales bacterium]MBP6843019.1 FKBP-type peptidyl-prolyl cis-trans isomerase [Kofleriaceae bacterium]